ncbi:MAG: hypothetical protein ACTSO9_19570 [Candidatus Helarchaeota archaeon]
MKNNIYFEKLAKKLDNTIFGLSKRGTNKISKTWMEYLRVLVPPEDVKYLVELNVNPNLMSAKKFARQINKSVKEATEILERLFENDCVMKIEGRVNKYGINLPATLTSAPPLSLHKYPKEKAEKVAKLRYKYIVEEEWYKNYEGTSETQMMGIIPVQESINVEQEVMGTEDVLTIIDKAEIVSIQKC